MDSTIVRVNKGWDVLRPISVILVDICMKHLNECAIESLSLAVSLRTICNREFDFHTDAAKELAGLTSSDP
jgi:hypothetical protein